MKKKISFGRLLLWIFLILVIGCAGFWIVPNFIVTAQIASRLHVSPTWDAIRDHLYDECKPGMTREEVHKVLNKVGPWEINFADPPDRGIRDFDTQQEVFREHIHFTEHYTLWALGLWGFEYDKNGKLVRQGPIDSG